jgi:hypothetical protein
MRPEIRQRVIDNEELFREAVQYRQENPGAGWTLAASASTDNQEILKSRNLRYAFNRLMEVYNVYSKSKSLSPVRATLTR